MGWLALLRLLLSLANTVLATVRERQLISAGEANAVAASLEDSLARLDAARKAGAAAGADFDQRGGVPDDSDPNLRD